MEYKVKIRRNIKDVKPEAEQIDGNIYNFDIGWVMTRKDSSLYIGETAMLPHDKKYPTDAPIWIASGDLESL